MYLLHLNCMFCFFFLANASSAVNKYLHASEINAQNTVLNRFNKGGLWKRVGMI